MTKMITDAKAMETLASNGWTHVVYDINDDAVWTRHKSADAAHKEANRYNVRFPESSAKMAVYAIEGQVEEQTEEFDLFDFDEEFDNEAYKLEARIALRASREAR